MRIVAFLLLVPACAAGCAAEPETTITPPAPHSGQLTSLIGVSPAGEGDLSVAVALPRMHLVTGQTIDVTVTVTNQAGCPVRIDSLTSARVHVFIWRGSLAGWVKMLRYPQAQAMVVTPWGIAANGSVQFRMPLVVEPTWPTHEPLRLTAAINGTGVASTPITIEVTPQSPDPR